MNLQKLILKNIFTLGIYKYLGEILFFISSLVISRLLHPGEYGLIAMIAIFYGFLSKFTDIGLTEAIIREEHSPIFLAQAHVIFMLKGVALACLMAALSYPIVLFFEEPRLFPIGLTYSAAMFLHACSKAMLAQLKRAGEFAFIARGEFLAVVFHISLSISFARTGFSYWSLVLPQVLVPFLYLFYFRTRSKVSLSEFNKEAFLAVWLKVRSTIAHFGAMRFIQYWETNTDNFWIGKLYGPAFLGVYNRAYQLVSMPVNLMTSQVNTVLLSVMKEYGAGEVRNEIRKFIRFVAAVLFWPLAALLLFPETIATWLWGPDWSAVGHYVGVLCLAFIPQVFVQTAIVFYVLFKKESVMLMNALLSGLALILLITLGAFYSIDMIMYLYIGGLLMVTVPLTLYRGYYLSFGFSFREIVRLSLDYYVGALALLFLKWFQRDEWLMYPLLFLGLVSLGNMIKFLYSFSTKHSR